MVDAFSRHHISGDMYTKLKRFVCQLYIPSIWTSCDNPNPCISSPTFTDGNKMGIDCNLFRPHSSPVPKARTAAVDERNLQRNERTCRKLNLQYTDMSGSCEVKCTKKNRNTDIVKHVRRTFIPRHVS